MYIVIELQKADTTANIVRAFDDLNQAKSAFYMTCGSAAISEVPVHTVVLMKYDGFVIERRCFEHTFEEG